MFKKILVMVVMLTATAVAGATLAYKADCCYPGSPCCYPGSPCCDDATVAATTPNAETACGPGCCSGPCQAK